ncbi:peptidylprolyl isomerase [Corynebacterium sp. ES2794-CONJ1]|uniref:peptidylprolyl isomerase n=1 Tax=Corynebacterium sp. ES2794-CONJ1 TaxID=2980553 RepID=UPI0021D9D904|nr:peptidylprolyl isomerase [Corynebacterium sp. ES2794-CONJ1]MCU9518645.1 peptidylprolyl isomerase [Corynebacterium sp. ES2794-CONJ1]
MKSLVKIALITLSSGALIAGCSTDNSSTAPNGEAAQDATAVFAAECGVTAEGFGDISEKLPEDKLSDPVSLVFETNRGDIPLTLDPHKAPCTSAIIAHLAKSGFYTNTVCHRLTTDGIYVLQCGDPEGTGRGGPGFRFADEYPVGESAQGLYMAGTVAMANAGPDTNGSQFFINYKDSPLPPNYTLFGTVEPEGMDVLRDIAAHGVKDGAVDGPPAQSVEIEKVSISAPKKK